MARTSKLKGSAKKKKASEDADDGIWACTIDGCDKQFAREADLKRHQRTTKAHSTPGFTCSLCDAAFTRPDALRRHCRSRHPGAELDFKDKNPDPDSKEKEKADVVTSYYRKPSSIPDSAASQFSHFSLPTVRNPTKPIPPSSSGVHYSPSVFHSSFSSTVPRLVAAPPAPASYSSDDSYSGDSRPSSRAPSPIDRSRSPSPHRPPIPTCSRYLQSVDHRVNTIHDPVPPPPNDSFLENNVDVEQESNSISSPLPVEYEHSPDPPRLDVPFAPQNNLSHLLTAEEDALMLNPDELLNQELLASPSPSSS